MRPNSPGAKLKSFFRNRWSGEDYPGGSKRFQLPRFALDLAIFIGIPVVAVIVAKSVEASLNPSKPRQHSVMREQARNTSEAAGPRIVRFGAGHTAGVGRGSGGSVQRAAGTLVKVRLLNVVDTYSAAPVHAQIIDYGLGKANFGATIIGDATSDQNSGRVLIQFQRLNSGGRVAGQLAARALSLDGSYGVAGVRKEGFFARAVTGSASQVSLTGGSDSNDQNLKSLIARMVAGGIVQEFKSSAAEASTKAHVFSLRPGTEFFAELTDNFPSQR